MTSDPPGMARAHANGNAQDSGLASGSGLASDSGLAPDSSSAPDSGPAPGDGPASESHRVPARRRSVLVAGLALLAAAAAFAGFMREDSANPPVTGMDHAWLFAVAKTRSTPLTELFKVLSLIGGPDGATIMVAVICAALLVIRRWRTALYIALAEASGSACSQLVKHAVLRHRPPHPLVSADLGSFPSGHVITAVGVGIALTVAFTRPGHRRYPLAGVAAGAALMMFCRTYLAAHWLSDTLESLPIAVGLALVLWWIFGPLLARDRGRPVPPLRLRALPRGR
jgi:membrane-associated phospholipid phosphatase